MTKTKSSRPCVHCNHKYGQHRRFAGPCVVEGCECRGYNAGGAPEDSVRVVTPDQLRDGYHVQRGVGDFDVRPYWIVRRLDDGNYLVRDPAPLNQKEKTR